MPELGLFFVIFAIVFLLFAVIFTVYYLVQYLGYLQTIEAQLCEINPIQKIKIFGKIHTGAYSDCGDKYTDILCKFPGGSPVGFYFDDPNSVDAEKCRYLIGMVQEIELADEKSENSQKSHPSRPIIQEIKPIKKLQILEHEAEFQTYELEFPKPAIYTQVEYNDTLSIVILLKKIYGEFQSRLIHHAIYNQWSGCLELYPHNLNKLIVFGDLSGTEGNVSAQKILSQ